MTPILTAVRKIATGDSGSALIEFTASATMLIFLMFGIMDGARSLYIDNFVANSAREAARYAMVRGRTWNGTSCATTSTNACMATATDINSYVGTIAPAGVSTSPTYLTVAAVWPGTTPSGAVCSPQGIKNSPGCVVKVKVTYSFSFLFPFLPQGTLDLASTSAVAISQ